MSEATRADVIQRAIGIYHSDGHIDMVKLAQSLDIDLYAKEEENSYNAEIALDKTTNKYFIIINANHPLPRQRFSIAHELAHFILHRDIVKTKGFFNREGTDVNVSQEMEEEADNLAAEILMPEQLVLTYCQENNIQKHHKISEKVISSIAEEFKVSQIVAILRLRHLKFYVPYISYS